MSAACLLLYCENGGVVYFRQDTQISQSCDIPHSLELQQLQASSGEDEVVKLKASSRDEITKWWEGLQQHLLDQGRTYPSQHSVFSLVFGDVLDCPASEHKAH